MPAVDFKGIPEFVTALKDLDRHAYLVARQAVNNAGALLEAETKKNLAKYSHKPGEPTPSAPGEPPALVSGALRRSVRMRRSYSVEPGVWAVQVGPTSVYSRIQELGGHAGRRATLPARPYLAPALQRLIDSGALRDVIEATWRSAWRG